MKRSFRGLRRPPDAHYDVVVIGSGIGGLIAANLLAKDAARVLLVEQHYMPGGYCSTFRRGGFTFDAGTHFYPLLGNAETLTGQLLVQLGVETRWIKMDPVDTFHFPDGTQFAVPASFDEYMARLRAGFPHQSEALGAFFAEVREAYLLGLLKHFRGRETPRLAPFADLTLRDVIDRHIADRRLRLLLAADCPHWGSPPSRTSFVFDSMLRLSYFLGNYYPVGGSQAFADELVRCFEAHGGHVLTSTAARRILVEGGRACGVELEILRGPLRAAATAPAAGGAVGVAGVAGVADVMTVRCDAVLSNADLLHTWESLVPREHAPPDYLAALRRLRPTYACFLTHLGLTGVDAATLEAVHGYHWDGWDADGAGRGTVRFKMFVPTLYEPAMAPPGGQVAILQKVIELDYQRIEDEDAGVGEAAAPPQAQESGWARHKREVETYLLREVEKLIPGIGSRIAVCTSATAHTSWRFTWNHQGAMLGWEMSPDQLGAARPDITGPLDGLYACGHWTRPGGGITPVIVSAQRAAALIACGRPPAGARQTEAGAALARSIGVRA